MKTGLVVALLVAAILTASRLLWLNADPPVTKRAADIANEGYWLHNARMKILTGEFAHDHFNQALITAPLYTMLAYGVFRVGGVGLANARVVSAVAGVLIIGLGFLFLWLGCRDLGWASAYALLLSVNDLFFAYNRLGLVETTLAGFVLLAFVSLCVGTQARCRGRWLFVSGVAFGLALLVKLTALYVLASFVIVGIFERLAGQGFGRRDVVAWLAGLASILLPAGVAIGAVYPGELWRYLAIYSPAVVGSSSGLYYRAVSLGFNPLRVVRNEFMTTFSVAILLVMLLIAVLEVTRKASLSSGGLLRRFSVFERLCLAWVLGVGLSSAYVELAADRRYWIVLVPLVVVVAKFVADVLSGNAGRSAEETTGGPPAEDREAGRTLLKGLAVVGLVYWSAPLLVHLTQQVLRGGGVPLRTGVLQAASLAVMTVVVLAGLRHDFRRWAWYLVIVPLAAFAIDWTLGLVMSSYYSPTAASLVSIVAIAFGIAYGLSRLYRYGPQPVVATLTAVYLVWNLAVVGQALAMPRLSIAVAAHEVDRLIASVDPGRRYTIAGANAHQLALESESLPLFLGLGTFYTELTKGLLDHPGLEPQYFLQAVPKARGKHPTDDLALPHGIEGRMLGSYCGYRHAVTGDCDTEVAVVKLTKFSPSEFLEGERRGAARENPSDRPRQLR